MKNGIYIVLRMRIMTNHVVGIIKCFQQLYHQRYGFRKKKVRLFIKKVPLNLWIELYNMMDIYHGEFLEEGENFIMEAMVSLYLSKCHPAITLKFYNLLYESENNYSELKDFLDSEKENLVITKERKKILYECLKLINKLHKAGLTHLDISPENILIGENYEMLLCDFGKTTALYVLNNINEDNKSHLQIFRSYLPSVGKTRYTAP
ncbi:serine/threonine protein kinase, FIKK family, putative [Plasmodium sp. DRC-Itaito]|nr:serine/threonine protein kinase, FIKK family, putative [Plasmodium sp. DRC-Itaito]